MLRACGTEGREFSPSDKSVTSLVTVPELRNAQPTDLSWRHLPAKRTTKNSSDSLDTAKQTRQTHLTQLLQLTATTHTLAITTISFVRLSTDSLVGECATISSI
ncbi:hypothetical protein TNCV_3233781 [Trichonephila clavipes]|nr:hypothetical protein TNCV_3233781 [Trichonephila clavipes]